jgi:hypothetical protein
MVLIVASVRPSPTWTTRPRGRTAAIAPAVVGRTRGDDAFADREVIDARPHVDNHASDLVAEDDGRLLGQKRRQRAVHPPDVAVAEPGRAHFDDDLTGARPRRLALDQLDRPVRAGE